MKTNLTRMGIGAAILLTCLSVKAEWVYGFDGRFYDVTEWTLEVLPGTTSASLSVNPTSGALNVYVTGGTAYVWATVRGIDEFALNRQGIPDPANYVYTSFNRPDYATYGYLRWNDASPDIPGDLGTSTSEYFYQSGPWDPYTGATKIGNNGTGAGDIASLTAGEKFGFLINMPSGRGQANLNIQNFRAPVPEPETYAMVSGLVLVGFIAYRRFRRVPPTV